MHLDFLLFPLIVADYDLNASRDFVHCKYRAKLYILFCLWIKRTRY